MENGMDTREQGGNNVTSQERQGVKPFIFTPKVDLPDHLKRRFAADMDQVWNRYAGQVELDLLNERIQMGGGKPIEHVEKRLTDSEEQEMAAYKEYLLNRREFERMKRIFEQQGYKLERALPPVSDKEFDKVEMGTAVAAVGLVSFIIGAICSAVHR